MEKQYILDLHNNLRRRVAKGLETNGDPGPQPSAANMRKLVSEISLILYDFLITYTGRFIMYSRITKNYYRKPVGHVFTKPVQIEGATQTFFLQ